MNTDRTSVGYPDDLVDAVLHAWATDRRALAVIDVVREHERAPTARIEELEETLRAIDLHTFDLGRGWRYGKIINIGPGLGRIHQMIRDQIGEPDM